MAKAINMYYNYYIIEKNKKQGENMKKGINSWSFQDMKYKDIFPLAKKTKYDGVELAMNADGEITPNTSDKDLLKIKKMAQDNGIELYSLASGMLWDFWINDTDKKVREKAKELVKRQLEIAKLLDCKDILCVPGCVNAEWFNKDKIEDYETAYNRCLEAFTELKDYAEELKINIALENVGNKFLLSPIEFRDFIDKIGSYYVGFYLDVGNLLQTGYPEQWIKTMGKRLKKVHMKDYKSLGDCLGVNVDLLEGDADWPKIMKALKDVGYNDYLTAEMIPGYKQYGDTIIYTTSLAMDKIMGRKLSW